MNSSHPLIYVVDDQPVITEFLQSFLDGCGYRIRTFHSPEEAIEAFSQDKEKPALIITDFHMGEGMNGVELIHVLQAAHPGLKSLLFSGTATPELIEQMSPQPDGFEQKPSSPKRLRETIRSLLAQP